MCNYGRWLVRMKRMYACTTYRPEHWTPEIDFTRQNVQVNYFHDRLVCLFTLGSLGEDKHDKVLILNFWIQNPTWLPAEVPASYVKKNEIYLESSWLYEILNRWRRPIERKKRAVRVIRRFYFDYVLPRVMSPHGKGGQTFLKLKEAKFLNDSDDGSSKLFSVL